MRATWLLFCVCALFSFSAFAQSSPYVDLGGLAPDRVALFHDITGARLSPCGDPETFADAINKEKPCLLAISRARALVRMLRKTFGRDHIERQLDKLDALQNKAPTPLDLANIPSRGPENAPITLVEFADYECPYCGRFEPILQAVLQRHPTWVRHYFINFPLTNMHPNADAAARAALAAKKQGKFWEMHDLLYERQDKLGAERYPEWAQELGLNVEQFTADMSSPEIAQELAKDLDQAMRLRLDGTPKVYLNGKLYEEAPTEEALENALALLYAELTGDAEAFLQDPGKKARLANRAEYSWTFFWISLIVQATLAGLLLFTSWTGRLGKGAKEKVSTSWLVTLLPIGVLSLVAQLVIDWWVSGMYGPPESSLPDWVTNWALHFGASFALVAILTVALRPKK